MFGFEHFGERLRSLRREKGLSQQDLASRLNVSHMTVRRLESNDTKPQGELLAGLVTELKADLQWLLTGQSSTGAVLAEECTPLYESVEGLDGDPAEWIRLPNLPQDAKAIRVTSDDMIPTIQVGDIVVFTEEAPRQNDVVLIQDARGKGRVRFFDEQGDGVLRAENQSYPPIEVDDRVRIVGKVVKTIRAIDV